jgi:hypothetical protein
MFAVPPLKSVAKIGLSATFPRLKAPGTGREVVQLTKGKDFCYPLYYYIPTITGDSRFLIHHRSDGKTVQLHRLELATGESVQITHASAPPWDAWWHGWDMESGEGVLDHRSVLNTVRNEVIYFDGNQARIVKVDTLEDRPFFTLPADRIAIGQNCVSTDGDWFVYIHHDRGLYHKIVETGERHWSKGTELRARNFDTSEERLLVRMHSPIHHVLPYGQNEFAFCHPATEEGMLFTNMEGGWYAHLRTQGTRGDSICHFVATTRGLAYEAGRPGPSRDYVVGLYDPHTRRGNEFRLPDDWGYTHTGSDPEGKLWFFETQPNRETTHQVMFLEQLHRENAVWKTLAGHWPTFGSGQKSHFHPRLTPDRQWIVMVAGDPATETNHIHLLDVSDLKDTAWDWQDSGFAGEG